MTELASRPVPVPSLETQPFWDGCAQGALLLQRCDHCGTYWHPPAPICPNCFSTEFQWTPSSGKGTIYTYSIIHQAFRRVWEPLVPYVLAVIELEEGPHLLSNVIDIPIESVQVGLPVTVTFQPVSDTISLPLFRPVAS
jgi:uncharacterized protein